MAARQEAGDDGTISGINVTPLVDITLVLLIIFLVTAVFTTTPRGLGMDFPRRAGTGETQLVLGVQLFADGRIDVDGKPVAADEAIYPRAKELFAREPELRAVIRVDPAVPHGRVIHALDLLKQAGVSKIAFAVPPKPAGAAGE